MQMEDLFVNFCEWMRLALLKIVDTYLLAGFTNGFRFSSVWILSYLGSDKK